MPQKDVVGKGHIFFPRTEHHVGIMDPNTFQKSWEKMMGSQESKSTPRTAGEMCECYQLPWKSKDPKCWGGRSSKRKPRAGTVCQAQGEKERAELQPAQCLSRRDGVMRGQRSWKQSSGEDEESRCRNTQLSNAVSHCSLPRDTIKKKHQVNFRENMAT